MANPSGQNSPVNFNGFVQNPPAYGDKQKQGDLARTAPLAGGGAAFALNTPRRSQKRASRPAQPQATPIIAPPQPVPTPQYPVMMANAWQEIASIPGASPLVQQLAQEAQVGSQG